MVVNLFKNWIERRFSDPQLVILAALFVIGLILILLLGELLTPVFASIVIAYLLDGMVHTLVRLKVPRLAAVIVVFILFVAVCLVLLVVFLPLISRQIGQLIQDLPTMISRGQKELMLLPERYPEFVSREQIQQLLASMGSELTTMGQRLLSISLASVRGLLTTVVYMILVPLMVFFFLKDKSRIIKWMASFLPENRGLATQVWHEVNQQITNYVRGKMWEILIVWSVSYFVFILIDLQFALLLGFFVGLSVLIPYIGATFMFFPVTLIAFFQWGLDSSFWTAVIAYGIIQALDGNLLAPLLLSEVVDLHPVAIIVSLLLFGGLWGIWGLFFAIPLATLLHAMIKAWFKSRKAMALQEDPLDA